MAKYKVGDKVRMNKQLTPKVWEEKKRFLLVELAKLEQMNWNSDPAVAEQVFPYVLVEAIDVLLNSKIVDHPKSRTNTSEETAAMLADLTRKKP